MPITVTIFIIALLINVVGFVLGVILVNVRMSVIFSILGCINAIALILAAIQY